VSKNKHIKARISHCDLAFPRRCQKCEELAWDKKLGDTNLLRSYT